MIDDQSPVQNTAAMVTNVPVNTLPPLPDLPVAGEPQPNPEPIAPPPVMPAAPVFTPPTPPIPTPTVDTPPPTIDVPTTPSDLPVAPDLQPIPEPVAPVTPVMPVTPPVPEPVVATPDPVISPPMVSVPTTSSSTEVYEGKGSGKYKVVVIKDKCIGAASCVAVASKAYKLNDQQIAEVLPTISTETDDTLLLSAQSCPTSAIEVYDTETGEKVWPK